MKWNESRAPTLGIAALLSVSVALLFFLEDPRHRGALILINFSAGCAALAWNGYRTGEIRSNLGVETRDDRPPILFWTEFVLFILASIGILVTAVLMFLGAITL